MPCTVKSQLLPATVVLLRLLAAVVAKIPHSMQQLMDIAFSKVTLA
jgi:hypothetical protein